MRKSLRQLILGIVLILSIAILALILLYSSGHRINWKTASIQATGTIVLTTQPNHANILITPGATTVTSPATITQLDPGDYAVTISQPNYLTRLLTASVTAGHTTTLDPIVLWPKHPTITTVSSGQLVTTNSTVDPISKAVLVMTAHELTVHDPTTQTTTVVLRQGTPIQTAIWYQPTGYYIIYATATEVRALDSRLELGTSDVVLYTGKNITALWFSTSGKQLLVQDDSATVAVSDLPGI